MPTKKKDNHVIQPDNMVIKPLSTVQFKERAKKKIENLKKLNRKGNK